KTGISGSGGGVSCHVPHDSETDFNSAARIFPKKPNPRIPTGTVEVGIVIYIVSELWETERVTKILFRMAAVLLWIMKDMDAT
ncbi:MAG: hypothetical protein VYA87_08100, partial [SAR324 cluster bacterium]|nr:hypothetical protein [SAR324 cluster bacterium]